MTKEPSMTPNAIRMRERRQRAEKAKADGAQLEALAAGKAADARKAKRSNKTAGLRPAEVETLKANAVASGAVSEAGAQAMAETLAAALNAPEAQTDEQGAEHDIPPVEAHEAAILAGAVSYNIHLFLGAGRYDRRQKATLETAVAAAAELKRANPECSREPMIYAVDKAGASTLVTADQIAAARTAIVADQPEFHATAAAAIKAAEAAGRKGFHIIRTDEGYTVTSKPEKPAKGKTKTAKPLPKHEPATWPTFKPPYFAKKPDAVASARRQFGDEAKEKVDFVIDKLKRKAEDDGSYHWVAMAQVDAEWGNKQRLDAGLQPKPRAKAAKAATGNGGARTERAPTGKRAELLEKAQRGILPPKPDFSAATHTRFRPKLDEVHGMVTARDIKGLKAFEWKGFVSSSPKAILKYRDLAVMALEAKTQKATA